MKNRTTPLEWKAWLENELQTTIMQPSLPFAAHPPRKSVVNDFMQMFLDMLNGKPLDVKRFEEARIGWRFDKMVPLPGEREFIEETEYMLSAMIDYHNKTKEKYPKDKMLKAMNRAWQLGKKITENDVDKRTWGFLQTVKKSVESQTPITEKQFLWLVRIIARLMDNYLLFGDAKLLLPED